MSKSNKVYIATSLDGFIAEKDGGIDFLDAISIPEGTDMGYYTFMDQIDALVMGRISYETVIGFNVPWPYVKPVFILSTTMQNIPGNLSGKVFPISGTIEEVLSEIHSQGFHHLYIDGGKTIQSFLKKDLIDEMIITTIPIILGGGIPLFGEIENQLKFKCIKSEIFADAIVQNHYVRDTVIDSDK